MDVDNLDDIGALIPTVRHVCHELVDVRRALTEHFHERDEVFEGGLYRLR